MGASNLIRRPTRRGACAIRREIVSGTEEIRAAIEEDNYYLESVCREERVAVSVKSGRFLFAPRTSFVDDEEEAEIFRW
ncbi:MAG: hypothetical protein HYZ07_00065 [Candidatus Harrisonbacteria bacterium]|nr:hypothetical protein [Candidatus Harrisonbacteria bacterium]